MTFPCPLFLWQPGNFLKVYQNDPVGAALMDQQIAVAGGSHVADDAAIDVAPIDGARRNGPALEIFRCGIETYQRIRPLGGFIIPDNILDHGEGIGVGFGAAGGGPFFDVAILWIIASQTALRRVDVPDHAIAVHVQTPYFGLRVGQFYFAEGHGYGVDFDQTIAAIAGDPRKTLGVDLDAVRP